jgi:hypothetical protein
MFQNSFKVSTFWRIFLSFSKQWCVRQWCARNNGSLSYFSTVWKVVNAMLFLVLNLRRFLHKHISFSISILHGYKPLLLVFFIFLRTLRGAWDSKDFAGSWRESLATVICMTNCTESLLRQTTSFSTQISTILPSRALPLFNCAPFLIGFQCGTYLFSYNAPDSTIVEILRRKSTSSASFALFIPLPRALPARLRHTRTNTYVTCCNFARSRLDSPRSRWDIDHHWKQATNSSNSCLHFRPSPLCRTTILSLHQHCQRRVWSCFW